MSLASITDVKDVNNLAPDQELQMEPRGLSIIYGDNGTGKSGYVRILKSACGARHMGAIEPNAYRNQPSPPQASASISYATDGQQQRPVQWTVDKPPHPVISAVRVFDTDCATVHIEQKNEVVFLPFGLVIPDELARACQFVQEELESEIQRLRRTRNAVFRNPPWRSNTQVGKALGALRHDTKIREIKSLGTLSGDEIEWISDLRRDLAQDPAKAAREHSVRANSIRDLAEAVRRMESKTSDTALSAVLSAGRTARKKKEAARLAANRAFSGEPLPGVGGEVWRELWEAARSYSTKTAYREKNFPAVAEGDLCVLCQQALNPKARKRMARFEEFIKMETDRKAQSAARTARDMQSRLSAEAIATGPWKANLQALDLQDPAVAKATSRFIKTARLRREALLEALGGNEDPQLPALPPSPLKRLDRLEAKARKQASALQTAARDPKRVGMQAELAELTDRKHLGGMIQTVKDELRRLKEIHFMEKCLADTKTNAITILGNTIADQVVTSKMHNNFEREIGELAGEKLRVELVRSGGRYGSPRYQVRLAGNPSAQVKSILSEGERTCVALAAFLTDSATAPHWSGFVFDDPVSSLDHRWRKKVAERLVQEAKNRQIVVFTHDLVFVNDLCDLATQDHQETNLLSLRRGSAGAGIVEPGLPWKGQRVRDRIDKLEKRARKAKKIYDADDEQEYERKATRIYSDLRTTWERALVDVAFFRVVQRHRDYIDTKHIKKATVVTETDCDTFNVGFKKCCDIVDAHDPSRTRNAGVPPPSELLKDIKLLRDWEEGIRTKQKDVS